MNFHWLWLSEMLEVGGRGGARAVGVHPWHPQATCTARLVAAQTQRVPSPSAQLPACPASTLSDPVSSDKTDGSGGDGAEGQPRAQASHSGRESDVHVRVVNVTLPP